MAELYHKLEVYMQNHPSASIGQVFNYFSSLGYSRAEVSNALNEFSNKHMEKTTDECN